MTFSAAGSDTVPEVEGPTETSLALSGVGLTCSFPATHFCHLISATLAFNRKMLLIGFAASNLVVGFSSSYAVINAFRIVGGICAGVMWPMIAAYGTRLVPENMQGKAITVIMSGNTLGISIGLPVTFTPAAAKVPRTRAARCLKASPAGTTSRRLRRSRTLGNVH